MGVASFLPSCFQELGLGFGVGIRLVWVGSGARSVARGRQGTLLDSPLPLTPVRHEIDGHGVVPLGEWAAEKGGLATAQAEDDRVCVLRSTSPPQCWSSRLALRSEPHSRSPALSPTHSEVCVTFVGGTHLSLKRIIK